MLLLMNVKQFSSFIISNMLSGFDVESIVDPGIRQQGGKMLVKFGFFRKSSAFYFASYFPSILQSMVFFMYLTKYLTRIVVQTLVKYKH